MNKAQLITAIADRAHLTKKESEDALNTFMQVVTEELSEGNKVELTGFGSFSVGARAARTGRNPQTGETIEIAASNQAKFKPGKALKDAVNQ